MEVNKISDKKTVKEVMEWLKQFPENAIVYAYEGEFCGFVVVKDIPGKFHELGSIETDYP